MLSSIDPSGQQFLNSMDNIQSTLDTAELELSSGLKVNQPSDAPDSLSPILQLHASIQQNQDIQTQLGTAQADVNAGATALSNGVSILQQASVLATEALGVNATPDTRASMAGSVQSMLQEMVSASATTVEGRYIFSGDQDQAPLYQMDLNAPDGSGVDRLATSASTTLVQGPDGSRYSVSLSANDIFDARNNDATPANPNGTPAANNVFAALNGLRVALANNDTAGIQNSVTSLQNASTYMNDELEFYGQGQSRVSSDLTQAQDQSTQLQTNLSKLQDADTTQAITELTQAQTQMQAALDARARMPTTTLFDVLPASST